MKIWKDKEGNWIDAKEFGKRFKKGVEGVTQLQQVKSQITFTWIMVIGLLCGITVSIYAWDKMWWVFIILIAALGNTMVGQLGLYQKKIIFVNIENQMKGGIENV